MRILIVEDDADIRELVELALTDGGYDVLTAPDGASALAVVQQHPPDLILLDAHLPRVTGEEFARSYTDQSGSPAPIVLLTASADAAERSAQIGAVGYVAKPFDLDDILEVVGRYRRSDTHADGGAQAIAAEP